MDNQVHASVLPSPVVVTGTRSSSHNSRDQGNSHRSARREHRHRGRSSSRRTRNRSRHSNRRENHQNCRIHCKENNRNFCGAAFSMFSIVLLCTALEPEWINMQGGRCHEIFKQPGSLRSLSTAQFFYDGHFYKSSSFSQHDDTVYKFGSGSYNFMVNCVTYPIVLLFKSCIAFIFIAVIASFGAFLLDLIAPKHQLLFTVRRNAFLKILTVLLCMLINMFTYWITVYVNKLQETHTLHEGSKVMVTFGVSFYLVTCAGFVSVMATACTCLRLQPLQHHRSCSRGFDHHVSLDDTEALLTSVASPEETPTEAQNETPPPPYSQ